MRDSPGTWGSGGCLPTPPSSPVESQGDSPSLHFWWKIRRVRSPLPTPSNDRRRKDKRQTRNKTLPNQDENTWELWVSVAPTADGRLAARSSSAPRRPCHHPQTRPGQNGWGGPPSQATSPQTPAACHQRQPRGPLALPTDSVCQRQEAGGGWTARWAPSTVGRRGAWEPPSAGPAGDRHATQVLRDPREGPASSLHPGPLAPLSLRTSFGRTHLSMQFVPTPPRHERPHSSRPSGLLSHMESISTLRNRGGGTGGPPTPRPLEAGGAAI